MRSVRNHFVLALAVLLAGGCAGIAPHLETPHLSVVNIEVTSADIFSQPLKVRMHVQNPNERTVPIKGPDSKLGAEGEELGRGPSATSFVVPALGETDFDMNVTANMAGAIIKLLGRGQRRGDSIAYRMSGRVALSGGFVRSV